VPCHVSGNMDIWDVLNAVFAGGVAVGASSDLVAGPGASIGLGLMVSHHHNHSHNRNYNHNNYNHNHNHNL